MGQTIAFVRKTPKGLSIWLPDEAISLASSESEIVEEMKKEAEENVAIQEEKVK